jgi:phospholipid/cholesterol/gamma-HCH transport system ATP-binding protein
MRRAVADSGDAIRALAVTTAFGDHTVLRGVDVAIRRGEVFVIMGPSGCGKTTMLRHLCGLLPPSLGSVSVDGHDLYSMSAGELGTFRLRTGFAFQGGALLGSLSVADNVALPIRENTRLDRAVIRQLVRLKLDMVGLLHAADLLPSDLSGGMRKRAAIARAIALDPEFLFLDEPSAGLDPVTAAGIDQLIVKLNAVFGITVVVVTHDLPSAWAIADRVAVFFDGDVLAQGHRDTVLRAADPRIRDFVERRAADPDRGGVDVARLLTL